SKDSIWETKHSISTSYHSFHVDRNLASSPHSECPHSVRALNNANRKAHLGALAVSQFPLWNISRNLGYEAAAEVRRLGSHILLKSHRACCWSFCTNPVPLLIVASKALSDGLVPMV
ncbi:hypothetical protein CEXT_570111, partial [Caerostris extrusa]